MNPWKGLGGCPRLTDSRGGVKDSPSGLTYQSATVAQMAEKVNAMIERSQDTQCITSCVCIWVCNILDHACFPEF